RIAAMVDLWSRRADHVTAGCDWVDYQTRWDTLMLAHFSIDPDALRKGLEPQLREYEAAPNDDARPLRVVHASNHQMVKGTAALRRAVENLRQEGCPIELIEFYRTDHETVLREMALADVVADQFVVGWYAMFCLEALSLGKPVLCYLRRDLIDLYTYAGLVEPGEIPILNTDVSSIESRLRELSRDRSQLRAVGSAGLSYVRKHHSTEAVGRVFDGINRSLGLEPRNAPNHG
ncbi:MAG: glycosyltransferase, partial [Phycisphaerae bacterium]|nr:glycosyltransferase [Phycisphaerae bacterium]